MQKIASPLIIAFDFSERLAADRLLEQLNPQDCLIKIGSEMFTRYGPSFVEAVQRQGFKVFLDLKFHDIPHTVARAVAACADLGVWMITLHASGGPAMLQAARRALAQTNQQTYLVAVTVLTSFNAMDLVPIGVDKTLPVQVTHLATLAQDNGMDGIVCSGWEVPSIKAQCGQDFLTVTPGIRLTAEKTHDQVRVLTPAQAIASGSDYLVIGRAITQARDPKQVIQAILQEIRMAQ